MAKKQVAVRAQTIVEAADNLPDRFRSEIDQHVAAQDQVEVRRAVVHVRVKVGLQVEVGKADQAANLLVEDEKLTDLAEVTLADGGLGLAQGSGPVDPFASLAQGPLVDVGGQDLHVPVKQLRKVFEQGDRQGIGLLAGRAAGRPDAQPPLSRHARQQVGQDLLDQCIAMAPGNERNRFRR